MKNLIHICFGILLSLNCLAQDAIKYIDTREPVKLLQATSRDNSNTNSLYHINYGFNWTKDTTSLSTKQNPKILNLKVKVANELNAIEIIPADENVTAFEFKLPYNNLSSYNKVAFFCEYLIDGKLLTTSPIELQVNFPTDSRLKIEVSSDGLYFKEDKNKPIIRIKSNIDGTRISKLLLKEDYNNVSHVAQIENAENIRLNTNQYTDLIFKPIPGSDLRANKVYYLSGTFESNHISTPYSIPFMGNGYRLDKKQQYFVSDPGEMKVTGHETYQKDIHTNGELSLLNMEIIDSSITEDLRLIKGEKINNEGTKWRFKIPSNNTKMSFKTYTIKFTGQSIEGTPIIEKQYPFTKERNEWKTLKIDFNNGNYTVLSELKTSSSNVYLNLEGKKYQMNQVSSSETTKYKAEFKLTDGFLKDLANQISNEPNNSKDIKIGITIDDFDTDKYLMTTVNVIDPEDMKGKSKSQIKKHLKEIGIEENIKEMADLISKELKKDSGDQNWGQNVWSNVVSIAPKVFSVILAVL